MNLGDDDLKFLRDLVKSSRQRSRALTWVDRDGTKRMTTLSEAEFTRLKTVAGTLHVDPTEALRQAAHIPNAR